MCRVSPSPPRRSPARHGSKSRADRRRRARAPRPAIISTMRSATSSCTQRSRSAEQRCPAERNAEVTTSSVTCSGSAVASTIMALMPPVSAISGTIGPSFAASARLMVQATSVEPVKATPATRASATSAAPALPSPITRCSADFAMPASCIRRIAIAAICGVCSAGLAITAIARDERGGDLTGEDRQREIPRADADEHAAPAMMQRIGLAGRPRHRFRHERAPGLAA